jgi:hypothetical protein
MKKYLSLQERLAAMNERLLQEASALEARWKDDPLLKKQKSVKEKRIKRHGAWSLTPTINLS